MKKLTKNQIMMLHHELITETGGSEGLRDEGLLDSALNAPFQSFDGTDTFPSVLLLMVTNESEHMQC